MEEEADLTKNNTTNTTDTIGKTFPTCEAKHLVDGEEIMPDTTLKTTPPCVDTVVNLATTRQSVGRRRVSQPSQADNSPTMPETPTMAMVAIVL